MIRHYKQCPPHEKYLHVSNFVQDLYEFYQRSRKGESATPDDTALCSAISSFLTKVYPSRLFGKGQASTTQCAFVLPSQEHTSKDFIRETLRPLLQTTPWSNPNDPASKTVFYSRIDTYAYQLNDITRYGFCLEREKKYLLCTLQKTRNYRQLMLTVNFVRAVYDPDLIAASGRSMTALGENMVLSSKLVSPPFSAEIPIESALAKIDSLAEFLYNKVFVGQEWERRPTLLERYNTDSSYTSLIHRLIHSISTSRCRDMWSNSISTKDFTDGDWSFTLSENTKSRLSCITYGDILHFFDHVDVSFIESKIEHYLQRYCDKETFQSVVILEGDSEHELAYMEINPYKTQNLFFAGEYCQRFYLLQVKKTIVCFLKQARYNKSTKAVHLWPWGKNSGCAYKISKMIQLSNRLGRPIATKPVRKTKQTSSKAPTIQKEKLVLIDQIQLYGYYVEVNISCSNEIKMSLNQVIETTAEDDRLQRSTMSILDSSWQTSDMYDFIFDALWNIIDRRYTRPRRKLLQEDESVDFDNYKIIRADLMNAIKNSMENTSNVIHNLDEVIYHIDAESDCTCDILITHRLVMDTGLLSYLKCIAGEIVASLKTNAIFGNYKITCLLVTGGFLHKLLEHCSSTYGEYAWNQLQEAFRSELNSKHMRVYLMMMKSSVMQDSNLNYKPFKVEKYRQVFSKHYFLEILSSQKEDFRVFRDAGNHWVEVPVAKEDATRWWIPIHSIDENGCCRFVCKAKFYIVIIRKEIHCVWGYTSE
ncbi:unnamed protein product [Mucor fragilis]